MINARLASRAWCRPARAEQPRLLHAARKLIDADRGPACRALSSPRAPRSRSRWRTRHALPFHRRPLRSGRQLARVDAHTTERSIEKDRLRPLAGRRFQDVPVVSDAPAHVGEHLAGRTSRRIGRRNLQHRLVVVRDDQLLARLLDAAEVLQHLHSEDPLDTRMTR